MVEFKLAVNWIEKLAQTLRKARGERKQKIARLGDSLLFSPKDLAPLFVEPYCQPYNPADSSHDEEEMIDCVPLFTYLEKFINAKKPLKDGRNQLFILSDAGMGKTSALGMFALSHICSFWPKDFLCLAKKIGLNTIDEITQYDQKSATVLILDSFDEDVDAVERAGERLQEILLASRNYFRVIISCRTQFLPNHEKEAWHRIKVDNFTCPMRFLTPFTDGQIDQFLKKKYKGGLFKGNPQLEDARKVAISMNSLRLRPLLLNYIEDFVGEENHLSSNNICLMYAHLIKQWLFRENQKRLLRKEKPFQNSDIIAALTTLAFLMHYKGLRNVSSDKLEKLVQSQRSLRKISYLELMGRSLLNQDSENRVRFAHYSIQEYLTVRFFLKKYYPLRKFKLTDLMIDFILNSFKSNEINLIRKEEGHSKKRFRRRLYLLKSTSKEVAFSDCYFKKCAFNIEAPSNTIKNLYFRNCSFEECLIIWDKNLIQFKCNDFTGNLVKIFSVGEKIIHSNKHLADKIDSLL